MIDGIDTLALDDGRLVSKVGPLRAIHLLHLVLCRLVRGDVAGEQVDPRHLDGRILDTQPSEEAVRATYQPVHLPVGECPLPPRGLEPMQEDVPIPKGMARALGSPRVVGRDVDRVVQLERDVLVACQLALVHHGRHRVVRQCGQGPSPLGRARPLRRRLAPRKLCVRHEPLRLPHGLHFVEGGVGRRLELRSFLAAAAEGVHHATHLVRVRVRGRGRGLGLGVRAAHLLLYVRGDLGDVLGGEGRLLKPRALALGPGIGGHPCAHMRPDVELMPQCGDALAHPLAPLLVNRQQGLVPQALVDLRQSELLLALRLDEAEGAQQGRRGGRVDDK
eukprot:scaffold23270_cov65-Phaeocystis_antarctica.AAC.3